MNLIFSWNEINFWQNTDSAIKIRRMETEHFKCELSINNIMWKRENKLSYAEIESKEIAIFFTYLKYIVFGQ